MTKSTRARYTLEFKEEAVRLVTSGERVAPRILACRSRRCIIGLALIGFRGDGKRAYVTSASIKEPSSAFPRLRAL
jgi:transposase-like protein